MDSYPEFWINEANLFTGVHTFASSDQRQCFHIMLHRPRRGFVALHWVRQAQGPAFCVAPSVLGLGESPGKAIFGLSSALSDLIALKCSSVRWAVAQ